MLYRKFWHPNRVSQSGYLIAGFIGACLLIAASRLFKKNF